VICPSRELARQTYDVILTYTQALMDAGQGHVRTALCMGGIDMREAHNAFRTSGVHIVVSTPGRLKGELGEKRFTLGHCRYLCLDEADRMVDQGFEDDIRLVSLLTLQ